MLARERGEQTSARKLPGPCEWPDVPDATNAPCPDVSRVAHAFTIVLVLAWVENHVVAIPILTPFHRKQERSYMDSIPLSQLAPPELRIELPTDIWNGGHGGFPSVTANHSGVSVTLPQQAIIDAGGGPLDKLVKGFLDRWAPEMCSDLFDFQRSHERMTLSVAVYTGSFNPGTYQEVIIDYRPSHEVNCVQPDILVW